MRFQAIFLSIGLIAVFAIGAHVFSDESTDNSKLTAEIERLGKEVGKLRRQVDYLMIDHQSDPLDIATLAEHVRLSHQVNARMKALHETAQVSAAQMHQSNYELRFALARLAFAKHDYEMAAKQIDEALDESVKVSEILGQKLDAGTVSLNELLAAQKAVADMRLEKNRFGRKIAFLSAEAK